MKMQHALVLGSMTLLLGACGTPPTANPPPPATAAVPDQPASTGRGYAPVRLGIRPSMDEGVDGVGVQSVSSGTTAEKGGVLAGDVIIAWNGEDLIDVMDMVTRLRGHVPGDIVTLIVLRDDGNEVELRLVMQANDDVRQD